MTVKMVTKEDRIQWFRDSLKAATQDIYDKATELIQGDESSIYIQITLDPMGIPEIRISKDYNVLPRRLIKDDLMEDNK